MQHDVDVKFAICVEDHFAGLAIWSILLRLYDVFRYECYYCKFKWRYLEVHNTICKICDEHGINLKNPKCTWCGSKYDKSDYAIKKVLALW